MSRIQVTAHATPDRLVLRDLDDRVALEAAPEDVVTVGNSIGGYVVAPFAANPQKWGFWRIGGHDVARLGRSEKSYSVDGVLLNGRPLTDERQRMVNKIIAGRSEGVVENGQNYLLATSSGSARNGVVHRHRRPSDPIVRAAHLVGCDKRTTHIVGWGEVCALKEGTYATTKINHRYSLASDGQLRLSQEWEGWRGEIGRLDRVTEARGGTYVVELFESWDGVSGRRSLTVALRPGANRRTAAEAVLGIVRQGYLGSAEWKSGLTPDKIDR